MTGRTGRNSSRLLTAVNRMSLCSVRPELCLPSDIATPIWPRLCRLHLGFAMSESGTMNDSYPHPDLTTIAGQRVTVMGLGSFDGGVAAVRFLSARGASVRVSDQRSAAQLAESISRLNDVANVEWCLGGHDWSHFADSDFVVVNPAVPPRHPIVQQLDSADIPITSEMNLFWSLNPGRTIAVTGSNGKSTTTALIHSMIKASGQQCWLGGNIGHSLLPHLHDIASDDWVVLELSSFQLHLLNRIQARPHIAVVTNFAPNHLDWHETLEDYRQAKQSILRWQSHSDWCVLNGDDADVSEWPHEATAVFAVLSLSQPPDETPKSHQAWFDNSGLAQIRIPHLEPGSCELPLHEWCGLRGRHNLSNALLSATAARLAGVDLEGIHQGLQQFEALPHRLQFVGEIDGRKFYNDSISTTPESTIAALDSFTEPIVILAGGYDKQVDLKDLARKIAEQAKAASLLGQTAPVLKNGITSSNALIPIESCPDFRSAFAWAVEQSSPGDVILLSPGCASYDWFKNFADRGDQFRRLVEEVRC